MTYRELLIESWAASGFYMASCLDTRRLVLLDGHGDEVLTRNGGAR